MAKQCPKCGHAIEKVPGSCNRMLCDPGASGCGHQFCYLCTAKWDMVTPPPPPPALVSAFEDLGRPHIGSPQSPLTSRV